ncbi:MAG: type II toxin-antitoxin system VapC family toxin [Verrucomicrobiaceae bacterium]|nr:type II toxin-antitoxin system VapC family toxin [Verrucomicrobiaceae bacterium]
MRLLDSNLVIYAVQPANEWLRVEITSQPFAVSQATRIEVLGWHKLTPEDQRDLEEFLATGTRLSITDTVADKAVELRQQKKMTLGDAFIAATALLHDLELGTRNTDDFKHISGLRLFNPFEKMP